MRIRLLTRRSGLRLGILAGLLVLACMACYYFMIRMPGQSHRGPLPPLTDSQQQLAHDMRKHVEVLANELGSRSLFFPRKLAAAAVYIQDALRSYGYSSIAEYWVERGSRSPSLEVTIPGTARPGEIIVIGAHYDAYQGTPGADDNASGVAAVLALAEMFANNPQPATLRFVFFTNEEPPNFMQPTMGSWVYANTCRARGDHITAMLSIESIGYYSVDAGSQKYPPPLSMFYPSQGNFIAFVGNLASRGLVHKAIASFRTHAQFPSEGAALPEGIPGVGWSDHWAFWQAGYTAIMVTDTAPFRNPHYHLETDTPETLDYERMARVVQGLEHVVKDLAGRDDETSAP